jgi:hypothetical protein
MSTDLNGSQINNQEAIRLFRLLVLAHHNMMLVYYCQDSVERRVSQEISLFNIVSF